MTNDKHIPCEDGTLVIEHLQKYNQVNIEIYTEENDKLDVYLDQKELFELRNHLTELINTYYGNDSNIQNKK